MEGNFISSDNATDQGYRPTAKKARLENCMYCS